MFISEEFITIIIERAKDKLQSGENEGHEVIVGMIAISREYDFDRETLTQILEKIYEGNKAKLLADLRFAHKMIDEQLIDEIIEAVK